MNPLNGIRLNKFIHDMLPTALIWQSKVIMIITDSLR